MKKILNILTISAICSTCVNAYAVENNYKPYIAADYAYSVANLENDHSYYNSGKLSVGSEYNKYFGTEVFYQYSDKQKNDSTKDLESSYFQAYGLDMIGYLPLGCDEKFALLGTAGIGLYTLKSNYRFSKDVSDNGFGYRVGGGVSYKIDNNWSVRLMGRYIGIDKIENLNHMAEYSVGIKYDL